MTDRDRPVPGQEPEAWRAGGAGAPDLLELQATDALLDRIALRLPTRDDLDDPLAAAFVALAAEVDAGLPVERRGGRGLNGSANGRRTNGHANGHGTTNGHTFGYADLRPGLNGHRPDGPNGAVNGSSAGRSNGSANGHANGAHRDVLGVEGYEIVGDGGELRPRPERPVSLADWKDRLVDLATRKPLSVLAAAAATVGIMFGAVLVGQNFSPVPETVDPGSPSVSETQLAGIISALSRADVAVDQGQVGSARQALEDAEKAVARLPQSADKEKYQKRIAKLRIQVDQTQMPSAATGPGVVTSPASSVSTSPSVVTTAPTTVSGSPPVTTSPTGSPTTSTSVTTTTSGAVIPDGGFTQDPSGTTTEPGVTPVSSGDDVPPASVP